jgi:hypothetical protein
MGIETMIKRNCVQAAVYWAPLANDGQGGMTYYDPVELTPPSNGVRWEDRNDLDSVIVDKMGQAIRCNAVVYLSQDVEEQGWLYLGTLDELYDSAESSADAIADPKLIDFAFEIKRFDKLPALKSTTEFVRRAYLGYKGYA